jgi:hypothetical protein
MNDLQALSGNIVIPWPLAILWYGADIFLYKLNPFYYLLGEPDPEPGRPDILPKSAAIAGGVMWLSIAGYGIRRALRSRRGKSRK